MENDRWISMPDRAPAAEDADAYECVLVWHIWQGMMVMKWHQVDKNRFISHWMPPPGAPGDQSELRKAWEREIERRYGSTAGIKK